MKAASAKKRAYRMTARADAAAATHRRILEVAIGLFGERAYDELALADVAKQAGVTVQTVLRRFGSKEGLAEAATELGTELVRRSRSSAKPGDVAAALRELSAHYEEWGDRSLRFLAQELRVPAVRRVTDAGRALHYEWVDRLFAPWLEAASPAARTRLRAQLIAATDVFTWKIMRHDLGLDAKATQQAMRELVEALVS